MSIATRLQLTARLRELTLGRKAGRTLIRCETHSVLRPKKARTCVVLARHLPRGNTPTIRRKPTLKLCGREIRNYDFPLVLRVAALPKNISMTGVMEFNFPKAQYILDTLVGSLEENLFVPRPKLRATPERTATQ